MTLRFTPVIVRNPSLLMHINDHINPSLSPFMIPCEAMKKCFNTSACCTQKDKGKARRNLLNGAYFLLIICQCTQRGTSSEEKKVQQDVPCMFIHGYSSEQALVETKAKYEGNGN